MFMLMPFSYALAQNNLYKEKADSAYVQEKYNEAIRFYHKVEKFEYSPEICYNLGCTYYRLDNIAKSILWFERALLLDPGNDDIQFNLELARSKSVDKIILEHEFVLIDIFHRIVSVMSINSWAYTCIIFFLLVLLSFALFFFSFSVSYRKLYFCSAILFLLINILCNICAFQQRRLFKSRSFSIIMSPSVTVKSTPYKGGNDLYVVHEGTKVKILDDSLKEWCEVKVADGKVGWIPKDCFELI